jgi:CubicO group peptidase (beta-lactamase class C family)
MAPVAAMEAAYVYSNNGYVVAGAMLEAKLGTTWEDLMRTHVFGPLKLTSAGFGAPGVKGQLTQPAGHAFRNERLVALRPGERFADNPQVLGPSGRVHMSLDDVLVYLNAHRDATSLLQPDSWRTLHTLPFGGYYGMGWWLNRDGSLGHGGSNSLWYAEVLFDKDKGISAIAATNEGRPTAEERVARIVRRAAAAVDA